MRFVIIPFSVALASCVHPSTNFVPTNPAPYLAPKRPNDVTIASTPPARPFYEIGFIDGWPGSHDGDALVLANMRAVAAQRGCDVLLVTGPNNDVSGYKGYTSTTFGYHAACVVLGEPPVPPAPPAPPAGLLFRNADGIVLRVEPEGREQALRLGWVPVEP